MKSIIEGIKTIAEKCANNNIKYEELPKSIIETLSKAGIKKGSVDEVKRQKEEWSIVFKPGSSVYHVDDFKNKLIAFSILPSNRMVIFIKE